MPIVAPWLRGTDVLGSIEGGARAGLSAGAQAASQQEAGARLKLAYDSLAQQAQSEKDRLAMQQKQNEAAEALRKQQASALATYRTQQQKFEQAKITDAQNKNDAAQALRDIVAKDTTGFAAAVNKGTDPIDAKSQFPHAADAFTTPIIHAKLASVANDKKEAAAEALRKAKENEQTLTFKEQVVPEVPATPEVPAHRSYLGFGPMVPTVPANAGSPGYTLSSRKATVPQGTDPASILRRTNATEGGVSLVPFKDPRLAGHEIKPTVSTQEDYDNLEVGAKYVAPNGRTYTKK